MEKLIWRDHADLKIFSDERLNQMLMIITLFFIPSAIVYLLIGSPSVSKLPLEYSLTFVLALLLLLAIWIFGVSKWHPIEFYSDGMKISDKFIPKSTFAKIEIIDPVIVDPWISSSIRIHLKDDAEVIAHVYKIDELLTVLNREGISVEKKKVFTYWKTK